MESFQGNFAKLSEMKVSGFLYAGQTAESVPLKWRDWFPNLKENMAMQG